MACTRRSRRSYGAGEWGRNRVRVFPDSKTGLFQIAWREKGRRLTRSLGHRDWTRAKRHADEFVAGFVGPEIGGKADAKPEPLTLERVEKLFETYGEELTPSKVARVQHRDRVRTRMFLDFLGRDRRPETLSQRDWDRFIRERRAGRIGPSGKLVSNRTIELDLRILLAVLDWATKSRDEEGRLLLDSNPLKGLKTPKEKNPTRVVLSEEEYQAMLGISRQVDWRFHIAFVLAHETGHRIGAIRSLRWADIDFEGRELRWRSEHEKAGYEHVTPMADEAVAVLEEAREANPRNGESGAARAAGPLGEPEPGAGGHLVAQRRTARGTGARAREKLALAATEIRVRPHEPSAQGAVRVGRLEGGPDGAALLPAGRLGTTQEDFGQPSEGPHLTQIDRWESISRNPPAESRKLNAHNEM